MSGNLLCRNHMLDTRLDSVWLAPFLSVRPSVRSVRTLDDAAGNGQLHSCQFASEMSLRHMLTSPQACGLVHGDTEDGPSAGWTSVTALVA